MHLAGARAGGEARDELVELRDLLFALRILPFDLRANLGLGDDHVIVGASVGDDGLVIDVGDVSADAVQKVTIVGNCDDHAVVIVQETLQPVDRVQVEMVGGLIEQQGLRIAEKRLCQQDAHLLSALQLCHGALVQLISDIEPLQKNGGITFSGVAILFANNSLELAQSHALGIGHVGFGVDLLAFFDGRPQPPVSHHHGIDHAISVEGKLVLAQDPELSWTHHRAFLRVNLAGKDLHES